MDPYDEAHAEGVTNWLRLQLAGREKDDPMWAVLLAAPRAREVADAYLGQRYLELLQTDDLFERYRELFVAGPPLDASGFVAPSDDAGVFDALVEAATELAIRRERLDDARARPDWSYATSPTIARAVAARDRRKLDWGEWPVVKYGRREHLRPMLERGAIRVSPAASYDDPSLDVARRDDELLRVLRGRGWSSEGVFTAIGTEFTRDEIDEAAPPRRVEAASDYYIFCIAGGYHARLFDDFGADACLVITDVYRFLSALREAMRQRLPGWRYGNAAVRYIDPLEPLRRRASDVDPAEYAPFFCKHFRYAYQHEIRAAWLPPEPLRKTRLDHVHVELGPLGDYCELVEL